MNQLMHFNHIFETGLLEEISAHSEKIEIHEGDLILDTGQLVRRIPLVLSGTIKVSRIDDQGNELLLYYVSASESCAMTFTCCMQQHPSEVRAVAEDHVVFLAIPIHLMDQWLVKYPTWKSFVMKTIRNRFNELLRSIDQIAFTKLDERLIQYLKDKSKATSSSLINLSHEQIAQELATSRVVISRLLKKLENDKKLLLYRHQIKLLSTM